MNYSQPACPCFKKILHKSHPFFVVVDLFLKKVFFLRLQKKNVCYGVAYCKEDELFAAGVI